MRVLARFVLLLSPSFADEMGIWTNVDGKSIDSSIYLTALFVIFLSVMSTQLVGGIPPHCDVISAIKKGSIEMGTIDSDRIRMKLDTTAANIGTAKSISLGKPATGNGKTIWPVKFADTVTRSWAEFSHDTATGQLAFRWLRQQKIDGRFAAQLANCVLLVDAENQQHVAQLRAVAKGPSDLSQLAKSTAVTHTCKLQFPPKNGVFKLRVVGIRGMNVQLPKPALPLDVDLEARRSLKFKDQGIDYQLDVQFKATNSPRDLGIRFSLFQITGSTRRGMSIPSVDRQIKNVSKAINTTIPRTITKLQNEIGRIRAQIRIGPLIPPDIPRPAQAQLRQAFINNASAKLNKANDALDKRMNKTLPAARDKLVQLQNSKTLINELIAAGRIEYHIIAKTANSEVTLINTATIPIPEE